MKVLFIRSSYGQPDSRLEKEVYSLSKVHEVEVLGWDRSRKYKGEMINRIKNNDKTIIYHHIGIKAPISEGLKKMFFPMLYFWVKVWKFLIFHKHEYDVLHMCDLDAAVPIMFLPKHPRTVYDIFDYYADSHNMPKWMNTIVRRLEGRIIRKSDVVIICSEARRDQILPEQPKNLAVIHNTPAKIMVKEEHLNKDSKPEFCKIVYVGALIEGRFLREICEVIKEKKDVELHIGGFGVLSNYISSMAEKYSNIFFYGKLSYPKTLDLESRCDIMIAIYDPKIPNHRYAAPNKFYESLMQKKPLIMLKNTGMDKYIVQNDLGIVVDIDKDGFEKGFSKAIDNLIEKRKQWKLMGERGYELYQSQFSWGKMESTLLKRYRELEA